MASTNVTTATTVQAYTGRVRAARIQVNAALTGTITVVDGTGAGTDVVVATVTNPGVGSALTYWDLQRGFRVTTSAVCDITLMQDASRGAHG